MRAGSLANRAYRPAESSGGTLASRVGIATGLVIVGDLIGLGDAQERGVVGETPNLAARLQGMAPPNAVLVAEPRGGWSAIFSSTTTLGPSH